MIGVPLTAALGLDALAEAMAFAALAGVGLALTSSLAILGATRYADLRRAGRGAAAVGAGALAVVSVVVSVAAVAAALIAIAD